MTALSLVEETDGRLSAKIVATPLHLTSPISTEPGAIITFEVLEPDGRALNKRVGQSEVYALGPNATFRGTLTELVSCVSTHRGLAMLRDKPTLRGTLVVSSAM